MSRTFVIKSFFLTLSLVLSANAFAKSSKKNFTDEEKFTRRIPLIEILQDAIFEDQEDSNKPNTLDRSGCSSIELARLEEEHKAIVEGFFAGTSNKNPNVELAENEVTILKEFETNKFAPSILPSVTLENSGNYCHFASKQISAHLRFFTSLYKKGFNVSVDSKTAGTLKPLLLKLADTNELAVVIGQTLRVYNSIVKANKVLKQNAPLANDNAFALFILAKAYENNAQVDNRIATLYKSYYRYIEIIKFTTGAYSTDSTFKVSLLFNDAISAYIMLDLLEKSPENAAKIKTGQQFNTTAYLETLTQIADLFPEVVKSTSYSRKSFNKLYAAEAIAGEADKQNVGNRNWLMAFIPTTNSLDRFKAQFNAVSDEMKTHIWRTKEKEIAATGNSVKDKIFTAVHVLRLTSNIINLKPGSLASVTKIRSDIETQLKEGKNIAQVQVNQKLLGI